jgi:hypothetical protein
MSGTISSSETFGMELLISSRVVVAAPVTSHEPSSCAGFHTTANRIKNAAGTKRLNARIQDRSMEQHALRSGDWCFG